MITENSNYQSRRLKVLMVAAAVHPDKGSEPGIGWGWILALSKYHDLWVITGEREGNREAIQREMNRVPTLRDRINFFFIPRPNGPWLERVWPLYYYRLYRLWHKEALDVARGLVEKNDFDIAHQLNMSGYREPGYLWKLDLPFVWGPVGGTANVPLRFAKILGVKEFCYHLAKVSINNLQIRFHPRVKIALRRAKGFVTSTGDTQKAFMDKLKRESIMINDNGPFSEKFATSITITHKSDSAFRISWSGLHISRKALPILLHALKLIRDKIHFHLDVIGDGPLSLKWKKIAESLELSDKISWHGWIERPRALNIIAQSDLFAFPSLHESTPTVVMEALSLGVPVICLDHCGQADVIDSECGIKIPITNLKLVTQAFAREIHRLYQDRSELKRLSEAAQKRVKLFSWDSKAEKMSQIYKSVII